MSSPSLTEQLSTWVSQISLKDIPDDIKTRAKYLILDGIACGLVGAHLPWSEKAAKAILDLEPAGDSTVIGWNRKLPAMSAALLNSSFIQGFELDDWHSEAPLHSNSILIPATLGAAEHIAAKAEGKHVTGADLLLSMIVGYEIGPRVGLALWGSHILSTGWHSGAVFGPAASAAAVGKLIDLSPEQFEDAFGTACTQASGLMSAQFGSDAKRMQHGFPARNGLLAAFLAKNGYSGIKKVFEQEYGGFLKQFSLGNGKTPAYKVEELTAGLGMKWQTEGIRVKPYSSMAGTHPTVDCMRKLQENHPEQMKELKSIKKITIELGEAAFHHGGWKATRPLTSTGAQMSNSFVGATQIVHGSVLPAQFRHDMLENEDVWRLVNLTECKESTELGVSIGRQAVTIEFEDGSILKEMVEGARGVMPPLSNKEIVEKWRLLTKGIISQERVEEIEKIVLNLELVKDISSLSEQLSGLTENPIA